VTGKTIADIVNAAAEGIFKEGVTLGLICRAESLSQQLLRVEHFGANIIADIDTILPATRDTFWYSLMNSTHQYFQMFLDN
jgi:hypothetical protein